MVFYKLGDNMATALATPFYLDMGFSPETIGLVAKFVSLWAVIVGSVLGAFIVVRIGINRSLWVFGVVQMVTILGFVVLAQAGADPWVLGIVIAGEYIGVGLQYFRIGRLYCSGNITSGSSYTIRAVHGPSVAP